jgi:histidinol-phosphate/aromatic aminotransferase/cobyric acid decarboxylase-like protein/GNAT superfamily N-acetyltransferase
MNPTLASPPSALSFACSIARATPADCDTLHRLRHEVYARELGQHAINDAGRLRDRLDDHNVNLVARVDDTVAGFISITPPAHGAYSIDKYFARDELPFVVDDRLFEVRLLTVLKPHRGRELATLLMYAALRWVEAQGGTRIVAIGRREVVDLYLRVGLQATGLSTRSGAVSYDLLIASVGDLRRHADSAHRAILERLEEKTAWGLPMPFRQPAACFHGGAFFTAIGERFDDLSRRHTIVNADVLDAWFPPAPGVLAALHEDLPWLLRTSPPTGCEGLIAAIADARGVAPRHILPGAGSSDLIFRALRHWLTPESSVLILDPTYGEYAHVLEKVIGCTVDRLTLTREQNYAVDLDCLEAALADHYDLVVLVNPNSPTGRHVPRAVLESLLARAPGSTRFWIDETYIEYAGEAQSLERSAAASDNVVVCKSMSKVYALSGARVAYLCAGAHQLEALRAITPPWVVGLPSQVAAVRALEDPGYYAARYRETAQLRDDFAAGLRALGWDILPGVANFLLCHLPPAGPDAATIVSRARDHGVFLRNAASMSASLGTHCVRIAVKDAAANRRVMEVLSSVLS